MPRCRPNLRRLAPDLVRNRQRRVGALEKLDRHEHHIAIADVLEVMHLELAGPIGLVPGLAGRIGVFDGRTVHQVLAAPAGRDGGPEVVEYMPVEAEPLSGLEPDGPD